MFQSRVLSRIFGPRRDEVRGGWRKLHKEELEPHALYCLLSIIRIMKLGGGGGKEMCGVCSTTVGEEMHIGYWWGSQKERDH
jgi:hypothetical protein